jgi:hypothetical protein
MSTNVKQVEPVRVCQVRQTHRVSLRGNYSAPNGRGRITVSRADGGRDPMRLVVSWNHALDVADNYAQAFNQYLARQNWGGSWVIGSTTHGYVAVCDDPQWGRDV